MLSSDQNIKIEFVFEFLLYTNKDFFLVLLRKLRKCSSSICNVCVQLQGWSLNSIDDQHF